MRSVDVYDPWASAEEAQHEYGLTLIERAASRAPMTPSSLAVAHDQFRELGAAVRALRQSASMCSTISNMFLAPISLTCVCRSR